MMQMSRFQIILLAIFSFFIIAGVVVFATLQSGNSKSLPPLVIWGVVPQEQMDSVLENPVFKSNNLELTYIEVDRSSFDRVFTESLAEGKGPDLIIFPQSSLLRQQNKLALIPYSAYPVRDFKNTFIEASEILLESGGMRGLPFSINPLVLYWNRTNFSNANVIEPPKTWDEIPLLSPALTSKDASGNIKTSAIALGEYNNITHAKEILATLFLQSGNQIVKKSDENGEVSLDAVLKDDNTGRISQALSFYTSFSNPVLAQHSWSRALPNSTQAFNDGMLAMYIGFAGELQTIRKRNPNLNFDVAPLPQLKNGVKAAFGELMVIAIPNQARNPNASLIAAQILSGTESLESFNEVSKLPPVRKDLLKNTPSDPYAGVFYESSLSSKVWLDPDQSRSAIVFKDLIESVTSGRDSVEQALGIANSELMSLLKN
jgi:multiple sugar transport system substrate-binding protein